MTDRSRVAVTETAGSDLNPGNARLAQFPGALPFFVSYARTELAAPDAVDIPHDVYLHLSDSVNRLLPLPTGANAGFIDLSVETGDIWTDDLLRAVGTCRVFVALLDEGYLHRSRWCAMEWHLFRRRTVSVLHRPGQVPASRSSTAIIPVLLAPTVYPIPADVEIVERFAPTGVSRDTAETYRREGLIGLYHHDREAYRLVLWKIALEIQRLYVAVEVEPIEVDSPEGLPDTFRGGAS